jgi:hypothetical protein
MTEVSTVPGERYPHHVRRDEIVDYQTYEDDREAMRRDAMAVKAPRRIHLGGYLTFLFENHDTMRYQIQEIMRVEKIVREATIAGELETYNGLLGGTGQLGCALLIEIDDEDKRNQMLTAWLGLQERLYAVTGDNERSYARFDPSQVGTDRLSAVQYLTFDLSAPPVALGCDFPGMVVETDLEEDQRRALADDLAATRG